MIPLNTKILGGVDYGNKQVDIKRLVPISHYSLTDDFYGGNVSWIGELKDENVKLLCNNDDGLTVVDIAVETFDNLPTSILKELAKSKKIEFDWKTVTKEEITDLLKSFYSL